MSYLPKVWASESLEYESEVYENVTSSRKNAQKCVFRWNLFPDMSTLTPRTWGFRLNLWNTMFQAHFYPAMELMLEYTVLPCPILPSQQPFEVILRDSDCFVVSCWAILLSEYLNQIFLSRNPALLSLLNTGSLLITWTTMTEWWVRGHGYGCSSDNQMNPCCKHYVPSSCLECMEGLGGGLLPW